MGNIENIKRRILDKLDLDIFQLAIPVIFSNLSESFIAIVDLYFVGKLGKYAITIAGLSDLYLWAIMTIITLITIGMTVYITRYWAANRYKKVILVFKEAVLIAIVFCVLIFLIINLTSKYYLKLMTDDSIVIKEGSQFLFILSFISLPLSFILVSKTLFNSISKTKTTMFLSIFANLINAIFDYIFIFKMSLSVKGAALAYLVADILTMFLIIYFLSKDEILKQFFTFFNYKFNFSLLKKIFRFGFPQFLEQITVALAFIVLSYFVSRSGISQFSAYQITMHFEGIIFLISGAFSVSASTLTGQFLGIKNFNLAKEVIFKSIKWVFIFSLFICLLLILFSKEFILFFIKEPYILILGSNSLKILAFIQIPMAISTVLSGALNGAGDTKFTFLVSLITLWLIRLPIAYFFIYSLDLGVYGLWLSFGVDMIMKMYILLKRYLSNKWLYIKV